MNFEKKKKIDVRKKMSQCGWHSTSVNVENVLGRRFVHVKFQIRTHTKIGVKGVFKK
jgi:hypothetical protein